VKETSEFVAGKQGLQELAGGVVLSSEAVLIFDLIQGYIDEEV